MNRLRSDREKDTEDYIFFQLANEREHLSLHDDVIESRQDISWLRGEISELQTRAKGQHRKQKYLLEMLKRNGCLH